jgi:hypothetical protein
MHGFNIGGSRVNQPKFEIGDRVTYESPVLPYQKCRGIGNVVMETAGHYYITWEDHPEMSCPHLKVILFDPSNKLVKVSDLLEPETPQPSEIDTLPEITKPKKIKKPKPKPSLPEGIKLGDHVCNLETGSIGKVVHLCDRCINIATDGSIESHNLELGAPRLEILQNSDAHLTVGNRVIFVAKGFGLEGKIGTITEEEFDKRKKITRQTIAWDDGTSSKYHYRGSNTLREFLEPNKIGNLPETPARDLHGYFEHYQPVVKGAKSYWYRRYVYVDISGKLRHHHVPNKLCESIEALWRSGASAKEICLALGKQYSSKNSA